MLATTAWGNNELWPQVEREARSLVQAGQPEKALESLLAHESALTGNTEYDYLLGVLALEQGRLNLAHVALERVVLVNPSHAGAWLDLAILAYRQDDHATASQLLDYVEKNFSPAPSLREQILEVRARLSMYARTQSWRWRIEIGRGFDANANNGLQGAGLELTPQGGAPVWVEYDASIKPRKDGFWQARLGAEHTLWADSQNKLDIAGDFYAKQHDRFSQYNLIDAGASARYGHALDANTILGLSGQTREIQIDARSFLHRSLLSAAWERMQSSWESKLLVEHEWRYYPQSGYADSQTPWLGAYLGWRGKEQTVGLTLRQGEENPQSPRAGGATRKTEAVLQGRQQITTQWHLGATLFMGLYRDEAPYSTLLANGARRRIDRQAAVFELTRPLTPQWKLGFELHGLRDRSNLPIARQEDWQGLVTLSYSP